MLVERAFKELGYEAEAMTTNLTSIGGLVASGQVDLIAAQEDLAPELSKYNVPLILVKNFTDIEGVKQQIKKVLNIS
jgi:galactitol-specific phosphotransferase system IIB component